MGRQSYGVIGYPRSGGPVCHSAETVDEPGQVLAQNARDLPEVARWDAVYALFVFLHLLERQIESRGKTATSHPGKLPS